MAAAVAVSVLEREPPALSNKEGEDGEGATSTSSPPVLFLYNHLHDAIRAELDALSSTVRTLDSSSEGEVEQVLLRLKARYRFLEQVYKYHSAVEDEVRLAGTAAPTAWGLRSSGVRLDRAVQGLHIDARSQHAGAEQRIGGWAPKSSVCAACALLTSNARAYSIHDPRRRLCTPPSTPRSRT